MTDGTQSAYAQDMEVVGSDVYIAGFEGNSSGKQVAKLWSKVGGASSFSATALSDGTQSASVSAITVVGSNVYIVGHENNSSDKQVAKLWSKVGGASSFSATALTDGTQSAYAQDMEVVGSDVYIAGHENNSSGKKVAKLWSKVGGASSFSATALSDGTQSASVSAITVVGSDAYIVGHENNSSDNQVAKLWSKVGAASSFSATALSDGTQHASAGAITVVGNDVYIAGYERNVSDAVKLWSKVGGASSYSATAWSDSSTNAYPSAITVTGSTVHIVGVEYGREDFLVHARYWRNGQLDTAASLSTVSQYRAVAVVQQ